MQQVSFYYHAHVPRKTTWILTATLKSFNNLVFDRTRDSSDQLFEFFVPKDMDELFCKVMDYCKDNDIVTNYQRLPNRLG